MANDEIQEMLDAVNKANDMVLTIAENLGQYEHDANMFGLDMMAREINQQIRMLTQIHSLLLCARQLMTQTLFKRVGEAPANIVKAPANIVKTFRE